MMDYIVSLSEGIMDAWGGIILALKQGKGEFASLCGPLMLIESS